MSLLVPTSRFCCPPASGLNKWLSSVESIVQPAMRIAREDISAERQSAPACSCQSGLDGHLGLSAICRLNRARGQPDPLHTDDQVRSRVPGCIHVVPDRRRTKEVAGAQNSRAQLPGTTDRWRWWGYRGWRQRLWRLWRWDGRRRWGGNLGRLREEQRPTVGDHGQCEGQRLGQSGAVLAGIDQAARASVQTIRRQDGETGNISISRANDGNGHLVGDWRVRRGVRLCQALLDLGRQRIVVRAQLGPPGRGLDRRKCPG
jgi:hypothetical protein